MTGGKASVVMISVDRAATIHNGPLTGVLGWSPAICPGKAKWMSSVSWYGVVNMKSFNDAVSMLVSLKSFKIRGVSEHQNR